MNMNEQTTTESIASEPTHQSTNKARKQSGKNINFFLLGMIVVAAAAITGLGAYYFANIRGKSNAATNSTTSSISATTNSNQASTASSFNSDETFDFYDGSVKLGYKLPRQDSYAAQSYNVSGFDCNELYEHCVSLESIQAKPGEWVVASNNYVNKYYFNAAGYGLSFNLLNGRFDAARLGCDEICGSLGIVSVSTYYTDKSLTDAWNEVQEGHKANVISNFSDTGTPALAPKLLGKEHKWGLETYKIELPYPMDASAFTDMYLTKWDKYIVLVTIHYNEQKNLARLNNLINSFNFK